MKSFLSLTKTISRSFSNRMSQFGEYSGQPEDLVAFQKQVIYRSNHLGIRELDMLVGTWANQYVPKLPKEECERFTEEILQMETLDLYKLIYDKETKFDDKSYIKVLKDYAESGIKYDLH